jgi:hypothetical protein
VTSGAATARPTAHGHSHPGTERSQDSGVAYYLRITLIVAIALVLGIVLERRRDVTAVWMAYGVAYSARPRRGGRCVLLFVREKHTELALRDLAQRADRHADFARERDRHAQRAAAR